MGKETKILESKVLRRIQGLKGNLAPDIGMTNLSERTGVVWKDYETIQDGYAVFYDEDQDEKHSIERCYTLSEKGELHSPITFINNQVNQDIEWDFSQADFYLTPLPKREWPLFDIIQFRVNYKLWVFLARTGLHKNNWEQIDLLEPSEPSLCHFCRVFRRVLFSPPYCPLAYGFRCKESLCCKGLYQLWASYDTLSRRKEMARAIKNLIEKWLVREGLMRPLSTYMVKE